MKGKRCFAVLRHKTMEKKMKKQMTKLKAALTLSDEEFKQTYSKPKLQKGDAGVIFYGLSSVKSSAAVEIAHKMGFKKSRHYPGGLEEWNQKNPKT